MKNWLSKKITLLLFGIISTIYLFAQDDKKVDVDISLNKDNASNWYQQPWVWIVGGAVFILLLVAMLRGSGKKE